MSPTHSSLDPLQFPFDGCQLIEASAGTGKTFTIAVLYLRAVLGHGMPARMPREILVTTFTELAADELKTRIHARLMQAARLFSGDEAPADSLMTRLLADFPAEQHPALADRLLAAADQMDDAAIHTIHGWCQRMLQEHAFLSGQPFSLTLSPDLRVWFDWAAQDYWRSHIYRLPDDALAPITEMLGNPEVMLQGLLRLVEHEAEPIHAGEAAPEFDETVSHWMASRAAVRVAEAEAKARWLSDRAAVIDAFTAIAGSLNGQVHKAPRAEIAAGNWQAMDAWLAGAPLAPAWLKLFCQLKVNKGAVPPDTAFQRAVLAWQARLADCRALTQSTVIALYRHAAQWLRARIATLKASARVAGFNDLLIALAQALHGAQGRVLAQTIAARYPLAMIDEFQDTDGLQLSLFDRVFGITQPPPSPVAVLVLIGDPKQLIYRFRNADIDSYLTARRAVRGIHTLKDNFRSTPLLVDAVNAVFQFAAPVDAGVFGGGAEIPFVPASAKGTPPRWTVHTADNGWTQPNPLRLLTLPYPDAGSVPNKGRWQHAMAEAVAAQIAQLLNATRTGQVGWAEDADPAQGLRPSQPQGLRPIQPQDIAILVSDRFEAQIIRRALQKVGVASVYQSDRRNLFHTTQAKDFWHWLNALAEPTRPDLLKIALATASCARQVQELDALRDEAKFSELVERMVGYRALWQRFGILAAVYQWLHDFEIPARLLADQTGEDGGARRLTNLLHLADWAQAEQQIRPGIEALRHRFAQALTDGEAEGELRLDQDEHLVQIMSIHASKGLQFPWVYLPFLSMMGAKESSKRGSAKVEALRLPQRGWVFDLGESLRADDRTAQIDEAVRKAYVALTRAESVCVLGAGLLRIGKAKILQPSRTALGRLWALNDGDPAEDPAVLGRYHEVLAGLANQPGIDLEWLTPSDALRFQPEPPVALAPARTAVARARTPWRMSSYSQIVADAGAAAPESGREAEWQEAEMASVSASMPEVAPAPMPESMPVPVDAAFAEALAELPRGNVFGTVMHDVLEAAGRTGFGATATALSDPTTGAALLAPQLPADGSAGSVAVWQRWMHTLLTTPLALPASSIAPPQSLAQLTRARVELEFWLPVATLDIAWLDAAVRAAVFPGAPRPALSREHLHGVLKGFMDVVFEADGRYFVLDYKSNALAEYGAPALTEALLGHRYDVQLVIYLAALHRHLVDRLPGYDPAQHLGGALYWFTRGMAHPGTGQCLVAPPLALLAELDACWDGLPAEEAS